MTTTSTSPARSGGDAERSAPLLHAEGLVRRFGPHTALDGLSLDVSPGEIVGLIGPSGGGKTTAVRVLCGVDRPDEGTAELFGRAANQAGRRERSRLAMLAQDPALVDEFTIRGHIRFIARLRRAPLERVDEVLERVDLVEGASTVLSAASGGMRRRAGLAAALVSDPDLAVCDEPTAGLDPVVRHRIWTWFRERRRAGRAMLVTTQHIDEAAKCDRVIVLREGAVLVDAVPHDLARESGLEEQVVVEAAPGNEELCLRVLDGLGASVTNVDERTFVFPAPDAATAAAGAAEALFDARVDVLSIDTETPGLDEVFRALVVES